tara:strand:- start:172 stop:1020 length:849 start_codon:yes stop_codon:yes gene_type:complete
MIIWISSYPKSGNTWLRSLISNYFFSSNGDFNFELIKQIDSFPNSKFFRRYKDKFENPEDTSKYWIEEQKKINSSKKNFFFKTHNALCKINGNKFTDQENTLASIYIIRDPRNVVTSIAHHYQINTKDAFNFMMDKKRGIIEKENDRYTGFQALLSWDLHVKSWTENTLYPTLVIRYEDLIIDAKSTFEKILIFIKKITNSKDSINQQKLMKCIENCKFSNLKKMETENGFEESMMNKKTGDKVVFFNLGEKNDFKKILDKNIVNEMNEKFDYELKKFRYIN